TGRTSRSSPTLATCATDHGPPESWVRGTTNPFARSHQPDAPTDPLDPHPHTTDATGAPCLSAWSSIVASQSARQSPSPASEANPPTTYESLAQTDRQSSLSACVGTSAAHQKSTPCEQYYD